VDIVGWIGRRARYYRRRRKPVNPEPEEKDSKYLPGLMPAMKRAAKQAREDAARAGTDVIVCIDGKIEFIDPKTDKIKKRSA
jgi:hypothetical protein